MSKKDIHEDQYHNTDLSEAIEKGDIKQIRELLKPFNIINEKTSDADVFKIVGMLAKKHELEQYFDLSSKAEQKVYFDVKDQLRLMGVDASELIEMGKDVSDLVEVH